MFRPCFLNTEGLDCSQDLTRVEISISDQRHSLIRDMETFKNNSRGVGKETREVSVKLEHTVGPVLSLFLNIRSRTEDFQCEPSLLSH